VKRQSLATELARGRQLLEDARCALAEWESWAADMQRFLRDEPRSAAAVSLLATVAMGVACKLPQIGLFLSDWQRCPRPDRDVVRIWRRRLEAAGLDVRPLRGTDK
jgi:hypothetical protein